MKAIVVTDQATGTAGVKPVSRPEPLAAINDVVVQIHASGFTGDQGKDDHPFAMGERSESGMQC